MYNVRGSIQKFRKICPLKIPLGTVGNNVQGDYFERDGGTRSYSKKIILMEKFPEFLDWPSYTNYNIE
jgi:hypothetical protein